MSPSAEDAGKAAELDKLWQTILARLQLPSTQAMLRQNGKVASWDGSRVVVQINQAWLEMAQARRTLLEQAVAATLGETARLVLTGDRHQQAGRSQRPVSPSTPPTPSQGAVQSPSPAVPARPPIKPQPRPQPAAPDPGLLKQSHRRQEPAPPPGASGPSLDATAKTLASFFSGEVVDNDSSAPGAA